MCQDHKLAIVAGWDQSTYKMRFEPCYEGPNGGPAGGGGWAVRVGKERCASVEHLPGSATAPSGTESRSKVLGSGDGTLQQKCCEANVGDKKIKTTWPSSTGDGTVITVMVIDREFSLKTCG